MARFDAEVVAEGVADHVYPVQDEDRAAFVEALTDTIRKVYLQALREEAERNREEIADLMAKIGEQEVALSMALTENIELKEQLEVYRCQR